MSVCFEFESKCFDHLIDAADVLTKDNIKEPIKDIRRALLEADVRAMNSSFCCH